MTPPSHLSVSQQQGSSPNPETHFDAILFGSGYGGAVAAYRLDTPAGRDKNPQGLIKQGAPPKQSVCKRA